MLPKLFVGAAGVAAGAMLLCNVAPWMVAKPKLATLEYLSAGKLQTLDAQKKMFMANELWEKNGSVIMAVRRPGCSLCRAEAQGLSSLVPEMESRGVRLHAVVHEVLGAEEFRPFIKGDVYLDPQRHFYGPQERWMNIPGIFSIETISKIIASRNTPGNMAGEGRLLGAVFVIGPGDQGILYQHHEKVIGDAANLDEVKDAILNCNRPLK